MPSPGTPSSMDELFRHDAFVRRLARSLVRDEHLAEDVVQDTYRAALGSERPRDLNKTRSWLATVVRNLVRLHARGAARRRRREEAAARPEPLPATADLIERVDLHRRVVESALGLPEPYRSVLLLRHFEELPHAEIARRLGVPLETMRTRLKRAHTLLREGLEREFPGDESRLHAGLVGLGTGIGKSGLGGSGSVGMATSAKASGPMAGFANEWMMKGILMNAATRTALVIVALLGATGWYLLQDVGPSEISPEVATSTPSESPPVSPESVPESEPSKSKRSVVVRDEESSEEARENAPSFAHDVETVESLVTGIVLGDLDEPIAGARVILHDQPADGLASSRALSEIETDSEGGFAFPPQAFHGRHSRAAVFVSADGYAIGGSTFGIPAQGPVIVRMARETALTGRVLAFAGGPIAGAQISYDSIVLPGDAGFEYFLVPESMRTKLASETDADGYFSVDALPRQRTVNLRADAEGYASWRGPLALSGTDRSGPHEIRLQPGASIRGTVTFADGAPVRGVRVGAQAWDSDEVSVSWSEGDTATDDSGAYALTGLGAGRWNVFIQLPESAKRDWSVAAEEGVELVAGVATEGVDFVLDHGAKVGFVAKDPQTGDPVEGVYIGVVSAARPRSSAAVQGLMTDSEGRGLMSVPPGEVRAYVMAPPEGYDGAGSETFELQQGEERVVEFWFAKVPSIRGRVVDEYERPVAGARVWVVGPIFRGLGDGLKTTSNVDGYFELPSPGRGFPVSLRAETDGLGMPGPVEAGVGVEGLVLQLQSAPTGVLMGRVLKPNGFPAAGAQVDLVEQVAGARDPGGSPFGGAQSTRTDAEGRFSFRAVWPGNHYGARVTWRDPEVSSSQDDGAWISVESGVREAIGGVTLDLGDLTLQRSGS